MDKKVAYFLSIFAISFIVIFGVLYFLFLRPRTDLPVREIKIGALSYSAEIADTLSAREHGLSGRESLPAGAGMLFIFPISAKYPFWMKGMNFPLDMIWIKDMKVIGITKNALAPKPGEGLPTYSPSEAVNMVLELNAGNSENIKIGDALSIE